MVCISVQAGQANGRLVSFYKRCKHIRAHIYIYIYSHVTPDLSRSRATVLDGLE